MFQSLIVLGKNLCLWNCHLLKENERNYNDLTFHHLYYTYTEYYTEYFSCTISITLSIKRTVSITRSMTLTLSITLIIELNILLKLSISLTLSIMHTLSNTLCMLLTLSNDGCQPLMSKVVELKCGQPEHLPGKYRQKIVRLVSFLL